MGLCECASVMQLRKIPSMPLRREFNAHGQAHHLSHQAGQTTFDLQGSGVGLGEHVGLKDVIVQYGLSDQL